MPMPTSFTGVPPRLVALRVTLLSAVLFGMLTSMKLWLTARSFPLLPMGGSFPVLPPPLDKLFFGALVLALLASPWCYRPAIIFFLAGGLFLYLGDQNRGQPWFYLYWVLLLLTLWPDATALATCRVVVSAVYVWAGIQKCNAGFYDGVVPYLMEPIARWFWPSGVTAAKWLINATPVVEIFIGIGLWIPEVRRTAVWTTVAVHAAALLLLGPLGHKHNLVVWPWNLAMIALVIGLFPPVHLGATLASVRRSAPAMVVTALVCLLPALSYLNWWDSYFSFALYSGNTAQADLLLSAPMAQRMPERLQPFVHPVHPDVIAANPGLRGLFVFDAQTWAQTELGVPPLPEPRGFKSVGRSVARFAQDTNDMQLLIGPRRGALQVLRATDLR
ncbi:MAG TPA: hypothetical protein VGK40_00095 [Verrucomicrobiae bacterium]|jgi:hypothetical protein